MKPKAFLKQVKAGDIAPGYLLLGPETFFRDRCRKALRTAILGDDPAAVEEGLVEIDLKDDSIARLIDETRTLSLFAGSRLIIGRNAEAALPKGRGKTKGDAADQLADYFRDPTPGVTVLFEATKLDPAERDDKANIDRVAKFYRAVPETVELDRMSANEAVKACAYLAKQLQLDIENDLIAELVDMLAGDMARLENELRKLALYVDAGGNDARPVTREDLETMTPEARQSGVFALSDALAARDGDRALAILDNLARSGAYWPMQLTFLAGLFRQALAVKEIGGRNPGAIQGKLQAAGVRVWPSRVRQLLDVAGKFSRSELEGALLALYETDRDLRRERPDDRVLMETLVLRLTAR